MKALTIITLLLLSTVGFSQSKEMAVIVEEQPNQFDVVFFSKLILVFVIGVIALVSYLNYHREQKGS